MAGAFRSLMWARLAMRQTEPESARSGMCSRSCGFWFRPVSGGKRTGEGVLEQ